MSKNASRLFRSGCPTTLNVIARYTSQSNASCSSGEKIPLNIALKSAYFSRTSALDIGNVVYDRYRNRCNRSLSKYQEKIYVLFLDSPSIMAR